MGNRARATAYDRYLAERGQELTDSLRRFVAIPSVSMTGEGIGSAVEFLRRTLAETGFDVEVMETAGNPVVLAEAGPPQAPFTLLVYGHYDVFPAEAGDGWRTAPFEATIDGDRIWGRGTGDNKGQILAQILGIEMYRRLHGDLPVRVKLLVEGEEETGSGSLPGFVAAHRERLQADLSFYSDGPMFPGDQPVLLFGVRGALCFEVVAEGAGRVLHSGNFGGVAPTPALELCRLLARMVAPDGSLAVPGAEEGVPELSAGERQALRALPLDREGIRRQMGTEPVTGDAPEAFFERLLCRPSFNVSTLAAGHAGEGLRTIIPERAVAKVDIRLVGDQDPHRLFERLEAFARQESGGRIQLRKLVAQPPSKTPIDHPLGSLVRTAAAQGFGKPPLLVPGLGSTTPDYVFTKLLGVPSIVVPYAPHDENNHAANESTKISLFHGGIKTTAYLLELLADPRRRGPGLRRDSFDAGQAQQTER